MCTPPNIFLWKFSSTQKKEEFYSKYLYTHDLNIIIYVYYTGFVTYLSTFLFIHQSIFILEAFLT